MKSFYFNLIALISFIIGFLVFGSIDQNVQGESLMVLPRLGLATIGGIVSCLFVTGIISMCSHFNFTE